MRICLMTLLSGLAMSLTIPGMAANSVPPSQPADTLPDWTVMFYVNGRGGLDCAAFDSLNEIASVPDNAHVRLVAELGRPSAQEQCANKGIPHWQGIRRFSIHHAMVIRPSRLNSVPHGMTNMGSEQALESFVSWAQTNFPAKQYMLVIWGHGNGVPLLNADAVVAQSKSPAKPCLTNENVSGTTKGVFVGDDTEAILYNRDIAMALHKQAEQGKKVTVVGFDACLMGNIETAYALRDAADVMVASEALVPSCSWNYAYSLGKLAESNGKVDARTVGKLFVKGYALKYQGSDQRTLAAVDLTAMASLGREISRLAEALQNNLEGLKAAISHARGPIRTYGPFNNLVDFANFLQSFQTETGVDNATLIHTKTVLSRIDATTIAQFPANDSTSTGLTIFLPQNSAQYDADKPDRDAYDPSTCPETGRNQKHTVDFVCDTMWAPFLRSYLGIPESQVASRAPIP